MLLRDHRLVSKITCRLYRTCSSVRSSSTRVAGAQFEGDLKPLSAIPGPKGLPLLGNTLEVLANRYRVRLFYSECFKKYGDIFKLKIAGLGTIVAIRDPASIEDVLRAEGKYPRATVEMFRNLKWISDNKIKQEPNVVALSGEEWKKRRTAIGKQAAPRNVQTYSPALNEIFSHFIKYIQSARDSSGTIADLTPPIRRLYMELTSKFVFDNDNTIVTNASEEDEEFINAVALSIETFIRLIYEPPVYKLYETKMIRDYVHATKVIRQRAEKEAEKVYSKLDAGEESETPGMMEQWLREGKLTKEQAMAEAAAMFMVGVDTTANQSVLLLHELAKHPEQQEQLYSEVKSVLGASKCATPQQLADMPYLKGCILESFRLDAVANFFMRRIVEDATLLGYHIPKDTIVYYSNYSAGRDERLFPDPLKFDPERWKRDERHIFAIQPFGFGARSCYGRRFAELEMKLLLIHIVSNFRMSTDIQDLKLTEKGSLAPDEPVIVKFTDRN